MTILKGITAKERATIPIQANGEIYFSNNQYFVLQNNIKGLAKIKFWLKVYLGYCKAWWRLFKTLHITKKCYYGPFKGEFGHWLCHSLPFLQYLYKRGVELIFCGIEIHQPFLVDEQGNSIIHDFRPLRDFFKEVPPHSNSVTPPKDVQEKIEEFTKEAKASNLPFWHIGDDFYYWFIHRNWLLIKPYTDTYDLEKVYKTQEVKAAVIFPRKKGGAITGNNGGPWDYMEIARKISPYFEKVFITGHPALSEQLQSEGNIEVKITGSNADVLEVCSNSQLIISQHSGAVNLGEYTNSKVLVIYNGNNPIESMQNTLRFKPSIGTKYSFDFAYNVVEIVSFVKDFTKNM